MAHEFEGRLLFSAGVGGGLRGAQYADSLYRDAGCRDYEIEAIAFPVFMRELAVIENFKDVLPMILGGVHGPMGDAVHYGSMGKINKLKAKILEWVVSDIDSRVDGHSMYDLLRKIDKPNRLYYLVHEPVLWNNQDRIEKYLQMFSGESMDGMFLTVENGIEIGSWERTLNIVKILQDLGLTNVFVTCDIGHLLCEMGCLDLRNLLLVKKYWPRIVKALANPLCEQVHCEFGSVSDAVDIEAMIKEGSMLLDGIAVMNERGMARVIENQKTTPFGADRETEIQRFKVLMPSLVDAKFAHARNFVEAI